MFLDNLPLAQIDGVDYRVAAFGFKKVETV